MSRSRAFGKNGERGTPSGWSQRAAVGRGGSGARADFRGAYGRNPALALRSALVGDSTIALHGGTGGGAGQHDAMQQHVDSKLASHGVAAAVDGGVQPRDGGVIGRGEGVVAAVVDGVRTKCRDCTEDGDVLAQPAARRAEDAAAAEFLYGRGLKQTDGPTSEDEELFLQEELMTSIKSDEETGGTRPAMNPRTSTGRTSAIASSMREVGEMRTP